jgi:hypothetical protein
MAANNEPTEAEPGTTDVTLVPAAEFDALATSLDVPEVAPQLRKIASLERRFDRA